MPDVIAFYPGKQWLILIESVTGHGSADSSISRATGKGTVFCAGGLTAFPFKL
jgi:hypothetical protein